LFWQVPGRLESVLCQSILSYIQTNMRNKILLFFLFFGLVLCAQEYPVDSIENIELEEVVILSQGRDSKGKHAKALGSIDDYLEQSSAVNMLKRGAYAWEPMLQGMTSERSVVTMDGMRIYGACTDKMDPVTSYVEITNFSKANISSGSSGGVHGGTIAGSIDLVRQKSGFGDKLLKGSAFGGFESVNKQKILGSSLAYTGPRFFGNLDFTFRDADNYKSGGGKEVLYSQYRKYNFSVISGFKIDERQSVEVSFIYDRATDVGYPALPMDVSLAEASIGSVQYSYKGLSDVFELWETKLYYNQIKHVMDDSHRPEVPIRMDMPGWSKTGGFYTKLSGNYHRHNFGLTLSGHQNNSLAEMTMYPNNPSEPAMYMMTWPDVNTVYGGIFLEDKVDLGSHFQIDFSAGLGLHHNSIESTFGLNSLKVFYPEMEASKTRSIKSVHTGFNFHHKNWLFGLGGGFSERAPSVSEAYGFYLFNSNDSYDYVGNPNLGNEKSLGAFLSVRYSLPKLRVKWQVNYFHIYDYIIGLPDAELLPMTIGAKGIKVYESLENARMLNTDLDLEYRFVRGWAFSGKASYRYGEDFAQRRLPLIQPFHYVFGLRFERKNWLAEVEAEGSSKNERYSSAYGETPKDSYMVMNLSVSKTFLLNRQKLVVKLGAENIWDKDYTTFSDWNNIPRPGRNLFVNLIYHW